MPTRCCFDVYFGTSFELTGQVWTNFCTGFEPGRSLGSVLGL